MNTDNTNIRPEFTTTTTTTTEVTPLDLLRERAEEFSKAFANARYEKQQAQTFILELCSVFGLDRIRAVSLEHRVTKANGKGMNFVDGFFPGLLLVEMKSKGEDLDSAYKQAKHYVTLLKNPEEMPRYILVCDFQNFHLYDLDLEAAISDTAKLNLTPIEFTLADLRNHVDTSLAFLSGYERIYQEVQVRISTRAAMVLTDLHDALAATDYATADMQTFLVRILFCLFADDTDIFNASIDYPEEAQKPHFIAQPFWDLVKKSNSNGEGLGESINTMFTRLNTAGTFTERNPTPYELLTSPTKKRMFYFPYVNGDLFAASISPADFNEYTRKALLVCCDTDWSLISPDIFGTMFQNLMHNDDEVAGAKFGKRRDFGAHYTSERNILRAIRPLFMDNFYEDFKTEKTLFEAKTRTEKLTKAARKKAIAPLELLYNKLSTLTILDPACGCGNFLVVAYRELRCLEAELIDLIFNEGGQSKGLLEIKTLSKVNVEQFYGIELDPTAAEIAKVALWLTDHQLNRQLAERFGTSRPTIPLTKAAHIAKGQNALTFDWNSFLPAAQCNFIVGNPPFLGTTQQSTQQKEDMARVFSTYKNYGVLDYVCAWYVKAAAHMKLNPEIKAAFVSTNSITQGEQVAVLWQPLIEAGVHIQFAHRTFKWSNDGSGVAAVHCVIVGFGMAEPIDYYLWDYAEDISANDVKRQEPARLNAYLVDAPHVWVHKRNTPLCCVPEMTKGSQATDGSKDVDGGNLLMTEVDKDALLAVEPQAKHWIRAFMGADEFINNIPRYCLWLEGITDEELTTMPKVCERVARVKIMRLASTAASTIKHASTSHKFQSNRQPTRNYLLIPRVSSENRLFVPIGYCPPSTINSDANFSLPNATLYHFAFLNSTMHNAWMRAVCGRMKSDYRYSNTIVYNNFPWAQNVSPEATKAIETAGQAILDARKTHTGKSLAWLYNPETMPKNLKDAHKLLDRLIDKAYQYSRDHSDTSRVAFLFEQYQKLTTLLLQEDEPKTNKAIAVKAKKQKSKN